MEFGGLHAQNATRGARVRILDFSKERGEVREAERIPGK
jgi:hypothetical protein